MANASPSGCEYLSSEERATDLRVALAADYPEARSTVEFR